jgi:hypothetical protein
MLFAGVFALLLSAGAPDMIPEGTILPVILNETLNTARVQDNDPILFTLADDLRAAGHRGPILIPRGSDIVGRIVKSQRAGHFIGRSELNIVLQEIITPTGEVYDGVSTKIIDITKRKGEKGDVKADGGIEGPVHRGRDAFLLLFPPTTLFQLIATPKRGPDVVLPVETRLHVKLMSAIYVDTAPAVPKVGELSVPRSIPQSLPATQPAVMPQSFPQVAPQATVLPAPAVLPTAAVLPTPVVLAAPAAPVSASSIDILVAPVALYPDAILRDLFTASSHPFELIQANEWVHQRRDSAGSLPATGFNVSWDSSVRALTAYPDLLQRMSSNLDWTTRLGSAFMAQPSEVLSAVQRMRSQANNLRNSNVTAVAGR